MHTIALGGDVMRFLIGLLIGYFLFSIRPILLFYRYKKKSEQLERKLNQANAEIEKFNKQSEPPSSASSASSVSNVVPAKLQADYSSYRPSHTQSNKYGTNPQNTWGVLWDKYGKTFDSLTPEQQSLIKYPFLNKDRVFITRTGKSFHSVPWCYTIRDSFDCISVPLISALEKGKRSCSKCVSEKQFNDLHMFKETRP